VWEAAALAAQDAERVAQTERSGLEVAYAVAVVTDIRTRDTGAHLGAVFAQLVGRFRQCWENVWSYPRRVATGKVSPHAPRPGEPRFKRRRDPVPITRQWQADWAWIERDGKSYVNIDAFLPRRVDSGAELG
jgi:hypothetical protein